MIAVGDERYVPQRVFCIGRNYAEHVKELGNKPVAAPVVFMKPATSLVPDGMPLRLPRDAGPVHHEAEVVLVVGAGGRNLAETGALRALAGATLGLDLTLRALQERLKQASHPWELAKAFEASAPIGTRAERASALDLGALRFALQVNGEPRQSGDTRDMLFPIAALVAYLSRTWELRAGDLIYTGTPAGVGPLAPGDEVLLSGDWCGEFRWTCE
jgi:2-keto-4-pentenoate hydratase/2-oxohepta-3-ene-1,7-dioic acid hydratase in catechol pathway